MNILAVDTTTKNACVSLKVKDKIYNDSINNEITHSEKLLPLIDKTLKDADIMLKNIDMFGIINGPGSFTGIRIGLATIKAFSHVFNKDIFSISSLELTAMSTYLKCNFTDEKYIISLIDAKNDRYYYSIYKVSTSEGKIVSANILPIKNDLYDLAYENIKNIIEKENIDASNIIFCGDIKDNLLNIISDYKLKLLYPTTNDLLEVIIKIKDTEKYLFNAFTLKAIYARASQAERVKNGEK